MPHRQEQLCSSIHHLAQSLAHRVHIVHKMTLGPVLPGLGLGSEKSVNLTQSRVLVGENLPRTRLNWTSATTCQPCMLYDCCRLPVVMPQVASCLSGSPLSQVRLSPCGDVFVACWLNFVVATFLVHDPLVQTASPQGLALLK